jgi:hypothetical protein
LELQNTAGVTVAGVDASGNGVGGLAHPPTFKNLIINGAMQVAQRGTSVTGITTGEYKTADRWKSALSNLGTWTESIENDAPTGSGFRNSLKMLCTTADAAPAAGDFFALEQRLEGQNLQAIRKGTSSAQQLTLSFWVKSNVTGTYIAELRDTDNTRQTSAVYSIASSATWEKKTIVFPADTTGAFDNDNQESLRFAFWLGAGTNFTSGTLQTSWSSTVNANLAVGQTNLAASTNNYWQITGVQLEVGSTATEFEFLPIDAELARCQRYFTQFAAVNANTYFASGGVLAAATTVADCQLPLPVTMRTTPALTTVGTFKDNIPNPAVTVTLALISSSNTSVAFRATYSGGQTAARAVMIAANNDVTSRINLSSEL